MSITGNVIGMYIPTDSTLSQQNKPADAKAVGDALGTISDTIQSYVLDIDYSALTFDTSEIVFESNTSSVLGHAILGQMVLA